MADRHGMVERLDLMSIQNIFADVSGTPVLLSISYLLWYFLRCLRILDIPMIDHGIRTAILVWVHCIGIVKRLLL